MNAKKIEYSILELAVISQGNSFKETLNNSLALAKEAEQQNYKRYWFAEHHNSHNVGSSATSVLIGYVAGNTDRIRVGSGGIMLPNHSPLIIAEQFGTLAHLYPNRIDLGLGRAPGTDQETAREIRSDFMVAAHSFPQEIGKIQKYFSPNNKNAKVRVPIAEDVDVPIYILGSSTDSSHMLLKKVCPMLLPATLLRHICIMPYASTSRNFNLQNFCKLLILLLRSMYMWQIPMKKRSNFLLRLSGCL